MEFERKMTQVDDAMNLIAQIDDIQWEMKCVTHELLNIRMKDLEQSMHRLSRQWFRSFNQRGSRSVERELELIENFYNARLETYTALCWEVVKLWANP
jgi:hypothetical protein